MAGGIQPTRCNYALQLHHARVNRPRASTTPYHSLLPNLVHLEQGAPDRPSHDPDYYYSIPNDWGTNGIIYRDDLITTPMQSWADFWEMARAYPQQTAVLDDQQDVINMALKRCGYSINETNPVALDAAEAALMELRPYISHFVTDYKYLIANGDVVLALGWNGDAAVLQEMGVPVAYILPEEGSEMWQDELATPANVGEPALAHRYLNFLLEPQIAVLQALYTLYPTPNITAQSMLPNHMRDNQLLYPPEGKLRRLEVATLLPPETRERRAEIWERFQTGA